MVPRGLETSVHNMLRPRTAKTSFTARRKSAVINRRCSVGRVSSELGSERGAVGYDWGLLRAIGSGGNERLPCDDTCVSSGI